MIRFVLLLAVTVTCAYGNCLDGWHEFKGYCYSFNKEPLIWTSAFAYCSTVGARLAEIDGAERDQWLGAQLDILHLGPAFAGLNHRNTATWLWDPSRRTPDKYTNWNAGEPNGGANEECLEIHYGGTKGWNDISCNGAKPYICEKRFSNLMVSEQLHQEMTSVL